jgi:hypothetical protein
MQGKERFTLPPFAMRLQRMGHPSSYGWLRRTKVEIYSYPEQLWLVEEDKGKITFYPSSYRWLRRTKVRLLFTRAVIAG